MSFGILLATVIPGTVAYAISRRRQRDRIPGEWGLLHEHERAMRLLAATIDTDR